ncbi:MAG: hypothetical protein ACHQK9_09960 [Reyranellales bacterium]
MRLANRIVTFAPNVTDGKGGKWSLGTCAAAPTNRTIGDARNVVYGLPPAQGLRENPPRRWDGWEGVLIKLALHVLAAVAMTVALASAAGAQSPTFLTEEERLVSYCAGVSESRIRSIEEFLKAQCATSTRRECKDAASDLQKAKTLDRKFWAYLTEKIYTSDERGPEAKVLAPKMTAKGSDDWFACQHRPATQRPDDLLACRETQGCQVEKRFLFLLY